MQEEGKRTDSGIDWEEGGEGEQNKKKKKKKNKIYK